MLYQPENVAAEQDEASRHSEHVLRTLRALVKDASGAAPTLHTVTRANAAQRTAQLRQAERQQPFGPDDDLAGRLPFWKTPLRAGDTLA